jgi:hypothetical protein
MLKTLFTPGNVLTNDMVMSRLAPNDFELLRIAVEPDETYHSPPRTCGTVMRTVLPELAKGRGSRVHELSKP